MADKITLKHETDLQTMFCPALEESLVLSVLHDLQDFEAAIELLGTLCAESVPDITGPLPPALSLRELSVTKPLNRASVSPVTLTNLERTNTEHALIASITVPALDGSGSNSVDSGERGVLLPKSALSCNKNDEPASEKDWTLVSETRTAKDKRRQLRTQGRFNRNTGTSCGNGEKKGNREGIVSSWSSMKNPTIVDREMHSIVPAIQQDKLEAVGDSAANNENDSRMQFLTRCFPTEDRHVLLAAINRFDQDMEGLMNYLLKKDPFPPLIQSYSGSFFSNADSTSDTLSSNGSSGKSRSGESGLSGNTSNSESSEVSKNEEEEWRLDLLVNMLPHTPRSEIQHALDACDGDISHAARLLMPADADQDADVESSNSALGLDLSPFDPMSPGTFDVSLSYLASAFPELSVDMVRRYLELANGNRDHAVDLIMALDASNDGRVIIKKGTTYSTSKTLIDVNGEYPKNGNKKHQKAKQTNGQPNSQSSAEKSTGWNSRGKKSSQTQPMSTIVAGAGMMTSSPTAGLPAPLNDLSTERSLISSTPTTSTSRSEDPAICRAKASKLFEKRNDLFRKAATAYKSGNATGLGKGRNVSSYYSQEAHALNRQAKEWERRAAQGYIERQIGSKSVFDTLDLHGLYTAEAVVLAKRLTEQWWTSVPKKARSPLRASTPLTLICGKGIHSQGGVARLFPAVAKELVENGWNVSLEERGCVIIKGKLGG